MTLSLLHFYNSMIQICDAIYSCVWANPLELGWATRTFFCRREWKYFLGIWPLVYQTSLTLPQPLIVNFFPARLGGTWASSPCQARCWLAWPCVVLTKANYSSCEFWEQLSFHTQKTAFCSAFPQQLPLTSFLTPHSTMSLKLGWKAGNQTWVICEKQWF